MTGQCTRYNEYEMLPTYTLAELRKNPCAGSPPTPAAMTNPAPVTGSSAHGAGKPTELSLMRSRLAAMSPNPAHDNNGLIAAGIRPSTPTAVASSAPTPNSHTRENVLK